MTSKMTIQIDNTTLKLAMEYWLNNQVLANDTCKVKEVRASSTNNHTALSIDFELGMDNVTDSDRPGH